MKKIICLFVVLITAFTNLNAESLLQANSLCKENGKYYLIENGQKCPVNDKVITVKLKEGKSDIDKGIIPLRRNKLGYIDVVVPDSVPLEDFACQLDKSGNYELIKYATYGELCATANDEYIWLQWYLDSIRIFDAWNYTRGNPNVKIAVIDIIPFFSHIDFYDASAGYNNIDWSLGIDYTGNSAVSPHGIRVAGVISVKSNNMIGIAGICGGNNAAGVCVIPYNVKTDDGYIDGTCVDDAIIDATDKGARVINMSFGNFSTYNPDIDDAITYAKNHGVLLVAASGNAGVTNCIFHPASNPDVIAVGSVGRNFQRSDFSNVGSDLDLVAPGENICIITKNNGYDFSDGTSFSAPQVSAVIGLMLSVYPQLSANKVRYLIESTAQKANGYTYQTLPEHPNGTWTNSIGYGVLDAHAAVLGAAYELVRDSQISGPVIPGSPSTYYVPNLQPGWYVTWSMAGRTTLPSYCTVNYPVANQLQINNSSKQHIKETLVAKVYTASGSLITTLTKDINTAYGFTGSYTQTAFPDVLSGSVNDGSIIWVKQGYDVVLTSSDFNGATVSYTCQSPYPMISTSGNTVTVRLHTSTSFSNCLLHCVKGDKVIEFRLRAEPSLILDPILANISNAGNSTINIELTEQTEGSEPMREIVLDSWDLDIYSLTSGKHVYAQRVSGPSVSIDTSKWEPDVYIVHIKVGGKEIVQKFSLESSR